MYNNALATRFINNVTTLDTHVLHKNNDIGVSLSIIYLFYFIIFLIIINIIVIIIGNYIDSYKQRQ